MTRIQAAVLLCCDAGCETNHVLDVLGQDKRDLFDDPRAAIYYYADRLGTVIHTVSRTPAEKFLQCGDTKGHHLPGEG